MMDFGISDKTALVTGGAGRIGSQDCKILAEEGADVVALDVEYDDAQSLADEINESDASGNAYPIECNLTDRDDVGTAVEAVREEVGQIDILVNNAATLNARAQLKDFSDDLWDRDVAVNVTGAYNITREIFPAMCDRGWGRVINMSSMAGWYGGFGQASYSTTKAALIGFGKTLALEGARHGVTSNIITPNIVVKRFSEMSIEELREEDEYFARIAEATPMRQVGTEADVANLVAYLSSEQASYITGQVVGVTGGIDLFTF